MDIAAKTEFIRTEIDPRLITMLTKSLHLSIVQQKFDAVDPLKSHVEQCMNWTRLALGRLFLEFLGMKQALGGKGAQGDDVTVTHLGGNWISQDRFSDSEWGCLTKFMKHSNKIIHLTNDPNRKYDVTAEVDRAIPIIAKAMIIFLYEPMKDHVEVPLSHEILKLIGYA
jgi:hypothetical protein